MKKPARSVMVFASLAFAASAFVSAQSQPAAPAATPAAAMKPKKPVYVQDFAAPTSRPSPRRDAADR